MNQLKTKAIVLSRVNYRETDRIITVLTPDYGKLRLIAKGTRSLKSKLAGGIELFSVNDISFIRGRGEISTLVSSRLETNFPNIILEIERVQLGYELLKLINHITEDEVGPEFYYLLEATLGGINNPAVSSEINQLWFLCRLIAISGHAPNLEKDNKGEALKETRRYGFDHPSMSFFVQEGGKYRANHIKYLRLAFMGNAPGILARVKGAQVLTLEVVPLVNLIQQFHL